jgi:hypothetical protein
MLAEEKDGFGTQMKEAIKNIYVILNVTAVTSYVCYIYIFTHVCHIK